MLDYKKLNFKCGLELHVQLESPKLFCRCPTLIDNDKPDLIIKRKLRAVAGLAGEKDIAALFEEQRNRTFHYEYSNRYACLIDLDSEPPISINQKSLNTALEISLLLNAKIEPKIVVQRKIVVDGSNPGGFQRTTLIATDGKVKTSKGIVRIPTILLEEDAARKIEDKGSEVIYRLDRLGFPLIEVGTSPDIKDPDHAKETAETLGMILKSTGKIKKGIGTIRQDVNLSIKGKPRVELKGFQDLKSIPKVIEKEIERQLKLKRIKPEVRMVKKDFSTTFLRPLPGEARMYIETDVLETKLTKKD
jgi:glutamyl-tRNA(Gln) amidotransferase subunit E